MSLYCRGMSIGNSSAVAQNNVSSYDVDGSLIIVKTIRVHFCLITTL